jgi:hypothetical protein
VLADAAAFVVVEALEHAVVERDEACEQPSGRIELDRESAFGEVDLDAVGAAGERAPDVALRLGDEVVEELLPLIAVDPGGRVEQAERRG